MAAPAGLYARRIGAVAGMSSAEFVREILPQLGTPREWLWRHHEIFCTAAGVERVIDLLAAAGLTAAVLALRQAWFEAQLRSDA